MSKLDCCDNARNRSCRCETGYWGSMDIMHDRAGYYICWGCLVWVPSVYTSPAMFLTQHPVHLGWPLASLVFASGAAAIYINWDSDHQRQAGYEASIYLQLSIMFAATRLCLSRLSGWCGVRCGIVHCLVEEVV